MVFCLLATSISVSAVAQTPEVFYKGKTIQIIVGNTTGTGFDLYARAVAQFMSKYIPGQPALVVSNMPGASGLRAMQYLTSGAPKDGTAIATFNSNLVNLSVLDPEATKAVDIDSFVWLASLASDTKACFSWTQSGVTHLEDLKTHKLIIGSSGRGSGDIFGTILNRLYGSNVQIVLGYGTNPDVWLAFETGEASGNCTGWSVMPQRKPDWIRDNKISLLVQFAKTPSASMPKVPLIYDLPMDDELRAAIAFMTQADGFVRPFAAPAGVPNERIEVLRKAFDALVKDREFLDFAAKSSMDIEYMDGNALASSVNEIRHTPAAAVELARKVSK
jgi:tripartite-type tricarboxylate transporter receptor subunit TctC